MPVSTDEQVHLLDNLQSLLEKQIEMARRSDFRCVEALAEQADFIIEKIARMKCFEQPEFYGRRGHLAELYKKLGLMIASSKDSVGNQLQHVDHVRKTLEAYHNKG